MQGYDNKNGGKRRAEDFDRYDSYTEDELYEEEIARKHSKADEIVAKKKKENTIKKRRKTALIVILILAILIAAAFILLEIFTEAPDISDDEGLKNVDIDIEKGVTNGRNNGMYTFLVVGRDKVGNNTDTIMVGRIDVVNKTLNVISIPRDTLINSNYNVKKINYIYPANVNTGGDAIGSLCEAVSNMLGFNVDNYIVVDIQAAAELVDCIGGVEFDVPVDMHYDDPGQDLHIDLDAGLQTLNGDNAVKVFRFRNTYAGGDIERIGVQHDLLMAIAKQTLTLGNVPNLGEIIDIVENHTETDLTADNIRFYIKAFLTIDKEDVQFLTMPGDPYGCIYGMSYVYPDIDAWLDMVNEYISPYVDKVTVGNVNMATVMNGNFYTTTGELPGGVTSFMFADGSSFPAGAGVYKFQSSN